MNGDNLAWLKVARRKTSFVCFLSLHSSAFSRKLSVDHRKEIQRHLKESLSFGSSKYFRTRGRTVRLATESRKTLCDLNPLVAIGLGWSTGERSMPLLLFSI